MVFNRITYPKVHSGARAAADAVGAEVGVMDFIFTGVVNPRRAGAAQVGRSPIRRAGLGRRARYRAGFYSGSDL